MMMVMAIGNYFDDDDLHNDPKINSHDISILYSYGSNLHICWLIQQAVRILMTPPQRYFGIF